MAIYKESMMDVHLDGQNIKRTFTNCTIGEGDQNGDRYGVRLFRDGLPVDITGFSVIGYFVRPDGNTIILPGTAEGNEAVVTLTENCYVMEGTFTLSIKVIGGSVTGTMRIVDGTVVDTTTDDVIDPEGTVPDIDELMAVIERAEDAAEDIARFAISEELISGSDYRVIIEVEE